MIGRMAFMTVPEAVVAAAQNFADRTALIMPDGTESFAELHARVAAAAARIAERARPGATVMMVARNSRATVHAWLGAIYAGAIPTIVNPDLTGDELDYLKQDLAPAAVYFEPDLAQ